MYNYENIDFKEFDKENIKIGKRKGNIWLYLFNFCLFRIIFLELNLIKFKK